MTTIHVKKEIWKILNMMKTPGESMNDVIVRLLEVYSKSNEDKLDAEKMSDEAFKELLNEFCDIANAEIDSIITGSKDSFNKFIKEGEN
ncbi:MAG: hypothetical protein GF329_05480 [Candidatus Lokiarchaeota archaeon]|nr:hypothetical protein [Candidatus Lokiarchaeota archaeon]